MFGSVDWFGCMGVEHAGSTTRMNSGAVLVRNSAWSRTFLWDWWTIADRRMFSDQEQFDLLYQQRQQNHPSDTHPKACPHIVILAPEAMNSDPPAMTQLRANHAILHLMVSNTLTHIIWRRMSIA